MIKQATHTYSEPSREIPVLGEYDVVIVGGGPSGCAAAISAARCGAKTLLIEKDGCLGGAAVSQSVDVILTTNTVDLQGIWHEFMCTMKQMGGVYEDEFIAGYSLFCGTVDPEIIKHAWDEMITKAGVNVLYHTYAIDAIVEDKAIHGVVVATKAGRSAIYGKRIIDCSADGMIAEYSGVQWEQGANNKKYSMAMTKVLRLGNLPKASVQSFSDEQLQKIKEDWAKAVEREEYKSPIVTTGRVLNYIHNGGLTWIMPRHRNEVLLVTSRVLGVNPLNPEELTNAEMEGRRQIWEVADFFKKYVPGCENSYIVESNSHIGIRSSRRIKGISTLTADDAMNFNKYSDSIARASWDIDIWPADSYIAPAVDRDTEQYKNRRERLRCGDYFDVRYGCIVAEGIDNLLMAGRCISAEHIAQSSIRIQQTCMATGEAAGVAAALSIKDNVTPRELDSAKAVKLLEERRAKVKPAFKAIKDAWEKYSL